MEVFSPSHARKSTKSHFLVQSHLCVPEIPPAPGLNQVQGHQSEAGAEHGGGVTVDWAGGGLVPGHSVWGPAVHNRIRLE